MRILKAHIKNYRVHRDLQADFAETLTLVQGPNESGKSTLAEAIHRALFLKAKGSGSIHEEMESTFGGTPEVSLEFEAADKRYQLNKSFGKKGSTTLSAEGSETLTGDAAEEELSRLLSVGGNLSGGQAKKGLLTRWAHLWVRQGTGDHSPLEAASEAQDQLRHQLQSRAGQGIMASQGDNQLIARFQQLVNETYTSQGNVKKGSDLQVLTEQLEKAQSQLEQNQTTLRELEQAAKEFAESKDAEERHSQTLEKVKTELGEATVKLKEVSNLRTKLQSAESEWHNAQRELADLQEHDSRIRTTKKNLESAEQQLKPAQTDLKKIENERDELKKDHKESQQAQEDAQTKASELSRLLSAWEAHERLVSVKQTSAQLQARLKDAKNLQVQRKALSAEQTKLSLFTSSQLKELRHLGNQSQTAAIRLEAYAVKLEVLNLDSPLTLNGKKLSQGESHVLTEVTTIQNGKGTELRLTPGNSDNLEQARIDAESSQKKFQDELKRLNITSIEDAEQKHQEFERITRELDGIESKLEEIDPAQLENQLSQLEIDCERHQSEREQPGVENSSDFSTEPETISNTLQELREQRNLNTESLTSANGREKALRTKREQLESRLNQLKQESQELETKVTTLKAQQAILVEQGGDPETLAAQLNEKGRNQDKAKAAVEELKTKLTKLGADQLELDQQRLIQTEENSRKLLNQARESIAAARVRLSSQGSSDPHQELLETQARISELEATLAQVQSTAEVRREILQRLKQAQARNAAALAAPLEEATAPYLEALFGPNTRAKFQWSEDGTQLEGLDIDRSAAGDGYFTFQNHSHGTREQIALAVRLAMAEVLATNHNGKLPIVLDDAFTHADKHRIEKLKRVLYQGSQRGLQIILLTCHPENYSGLAPKEISLTR